jgi:sugar phosphate isomerase/epimerase
MSAGIHRHLLPGEGDLDLVGVCHTLSAIGYRGYYTIDLFNIADDPAGWAAQALDAMRTIAAEVGA